MKIIVLGAVGYLGAQLSSHLAKEGHHVIAVVRSLPIEHQAWYSMMGEVIVGDIRSEETLQQLVDCQADVLINTVSLNHHASGKDIEETLAVNVQPTWKLLDLLSKQGIRYIYFSTQQVYGRLGVERVNEERKARPVNSYGLTHLLSEQICDYYNELTDGNSVCLRLSNGYGTPVFVSNDCWWLVVNDFCKAASSEGFIRMLSDGTPLRDFIHVHDICRAVELISTLPSAQLKHSCYNLGSGETLTILELAHRVKDVFKKEFNIEIPVYMPDGSISKAPLGHENMNRFEYDISRLSDLGFSLAAPLSQGIKELFQYLKKG
jgi:nucleoside-diphosphate-sugar epimerase